MSEPPSAAPLTEAQSGLWFAQRLDPLNPIFNTGQYLDMRGPLDLLAFRDAVDRASAEAEALALRIEDKPGGQVQRIDPSLCPRLVFSDLSGEADPEAAALTAVRADMAAPVDPAVGPLAGQQLFRLASDRHIWSQRVHHLAIDGYGMVLLTGRVAEIYAEALSENARRGRPLGPLSDVFAEDADYRASAQRVEDAAWWRKAMADAEELVGMAPGKPQSAHTFHRFERPLPDATCKALLDRAKELRLGWPDVLTALVAGYCRRFTGTDEIVIGVPFMGRMGSASARVPVMVMNVLPLRVRPDEDEPLADFLARVAADTAEARRHGRYRSEQLRRDLGLLGGDRRLYGPLVNVQPYDRPPRFHGLDVTLHVTGTGPVEDINFTFRGDGKSGLSIEVDANPDLYGLPEVAAHGERLAVFIGEAVHAARLADVPTATPEEAETELKTYSATGHPVPDTTLVELIERTMTLRPDAPALRFSGETLDYAEFDRRTAALAAQLKARGAGADSVVAVALPRSIDLVVALFAVLRAGAAYLPLDVGHPAARVSIILKDASPVAVLAMDDPYGLYGDRLLASGDWPSFPTEAPLPPAPDDAAYVIYTSGSTGTPKGVVVTHRAIVNRLLWMGTHYGIGPGDRILQKTPATFDVSVWEFFLPAVTGGLLVVAPPEAHRDPAAIARLIRSEGITTLHFVPSMLAVFLDAPESDGLGITRVFCSGEELPADLRDRFHARMTAELHNLYGPTEAAVDVSYWPAGPEDRSRPVPIGRPVWNTRLVLLDERRRPVPPGMAGHLYLGGVQLAREYLGRADLTAERFVEDPYRPGERLYLTGDLARRRTDGSVVFLGRADHQVKIRGLRIELGEIEVAIMESRRVRTVAAVAREQRIVAYVVPGAGYDAETLRTEIAARLPDYMVPSAFVELDALPLSANGKLDRKALPEPRFHGVVGDAPSSDTERQLTALFGELLGVEGALSRSDDFFALGGDSLKAVTLILQIRDVWGCDPGLAAVFARPDLAGLAARIDACVRGDAVEDEGAGPVVTLTQGAPERPALFLVHPAGGLCWGYRTLSRLLSPVRTVHGLQSPALDPANPKPADISALAADYAARMRELQPEGPYHIAGWSVGGVIAQAIAVELYSLGHEVGLVAMLDSYPAECWRDEPEPTRSQALRALLAIAGYDPERYPHLETQEQVRDFLRAGDSPLGNLPPRILDGVVRAVLDTNRLVRGHRHEKFAGTLTHVRAGADHWDKPQLQAALWTPYASALDLVSVPFLHPQLTGAEASALIAPLLSARMSSKERISA